MKFVEGDIGARAAEGDACALDGEDSFVEVALRGREFGGDGEGAGYVGDVVAVFLGGG